MAVAKVELKQTVMRSEKERDLLNQFYTGSLNLELHPVPRTTTGCH